MDMSQLQFDRHDTNVTPNQGRHVGELAITSAASRRALRRRPRTRRCSAWPRRSSASRWQPHGQQGCRLGRRQDGHLRPADRRQALQRRDAGELQHGSDVPAYSATADGGRRARSPVQPGRSRSASTRSSARAVPRIDIPAKVTGTYTYVHNVRVPGMLHGRLVRPRGQAPYGDGTNPSRLGRRELDQPHPGREGRSEGNFLGVVAPKEYDAIQAAAQLKVKWAETPASCPAVGNLWKQMRSQDATGQATRAFRTTPGQRRQRARPARRRPSRRPTRIALQRPRADRPDLRGRRRDARRRTDLLRTRRTATTPAAGPGRAGARRAEPAGEQDPRLVRRGLERLRHRAVRRRDPVGRGALAARRRAGAAPVHALGRARLGQLRPGAADGHPRRRRRERQHRRDRLHRTSRSSSTASRPDEQELGAEAGPARVQLHRTPTNIGGAVQVPNRRVTLQAAPADRPATSARRSCGRRSRRQSMFAYEQMIDELAHAAKHGPGRVPAPEHREQRVRVAERASRSPGTAGRTRSTEVAKISNWQPKVAASKLESRQHRHRPRRRARRLRRDDGRDRRRRQGEQEDREDQRDPPLRRPGHRPRRVPRAASRTRRSGA